MMLPWPPFLLHVVSKVEVGIPGGQQKNAKPGAEQCRKRHGRWGVKTRGQVHVQPWGGKCPGTRSPALAHRWGRCGVDGHSPHAQEGLGLHLTHHTKERLPFPPGKPGCGRLGQPFDGPVSWRPSSLSRWGPHACREWLLLPHFCALQGDVMTRSLPLLREAQPSPGDPAPRTVPGGSPECAVRAPCPPACMSTDTVASAGAPPCSPPLPGWLVHLRASLSPGTCVLTPSGLPAMRRIVLF